MLLSIYLEYVLRFLARYFIYAQLFLWYISGVGVSVISLHWSFLTDKYSTKSDMITTNNE